MVLIGDSIASLTFSLAFWIARSRNLCPSHEMSHNLATRELNSCLTHQSVYSWVDQKGLENTPTPQAASPVSCHL
jgi:hypothetical protein